MSSLDELFAAVRRCGLVPVLLRVVIALGLAGAVVATAVPDWDVPEGYLWIAVIAGLPGVVAPDAGAAAIASAAVLVAWAIGAPGGIGPAVVVTALCLLVVHVASALAATMPVTARASIGLPLRWLRPTAALAGGTLATAGLVALLDRWSPPGSIVLVVLALGGLAGGVWWWTSGDAG
jgi:hypothetical protein